MLHADGSTNTTEPGWHLIKTRIHNTWRAVRRFTPQFLQNPIRCVATTILGPVGFATRSGFFRSAFSMAPVGKDGEPIPWYSYPCIDFLTCRRFHDKRILEFGGGNSTIWWARRSKQVVTLESDAEWYDRIKRRMPSNVELLYVLQDRRETSADNVERVLRRQPTEQFDVIIIDGLYREEMIAIAIRLLSDDGAIVCDDSQGYSFHERFLGAGFWRVDFFGGQPCGVFAHATSIYFRPSACFLMRDDWPIPDVTQE